MLPYQPMGFKYQAIKERWKRGIALMNYWFLNCRKKQDILNLNETQKRRRKKSIFICIHVSGMSVTRWETEKDGKAEQNGGSLIAFSCLPFQMEKIFPSCKLCLFCKTVATYVAMQIHLCANQIVVRNSIQYCICSRPPIDHSCTHT